MTDAPQHPVPRFQRDDSVSQSEQMRTQPLPAARPDLQISPQLYLGRTVYVVKDPVSLSYYRLNPAEHYVLKHLDGNHSANQLAHEVCRRFPEQATEPDDVLMFVRMMHSTGLLLGTGIHGAQLREMRRMKIKRKRFATLTNFLFYQLPVFDPDQLLGMLHRAIAHIMTPLLSTLALIYIAVSFAAAILHLDRIQHASMPILSWQNLLLMSIVFFAVKIIHEFGHGLAAKHRGLEVHEMGILFMVFIPMFYVDTTDAWMVPRRRDRLWIAAGGVFIEFLFAATAVWIWLYTNPDGIVSLIALDTMIAASVTTFLFNANPLLRYDGYYFLMDWLEIPNLKTKANEHLAYLAKRYLLAMNELEPQPEAANKPIFMPIYAVASALYRVLITFGIIMLVYHILDPYGLEAIGSLLGIAAFFVMIIVPMYKFLKFIWTQQARTTRRGALTAVGVSALALLLWAVASIPVQQVVEQPTVALADERQPVFVAATGRVVELLIDSQKVLQANQPILRMEDPELQEKFESIDIEIAKTQLKLDSARAAGRPGQLAALTQRVSLLNTQRKDLQRRINLLTLRAPIPGRLFVTGDLSALLGTHLEQGQQLGTIVGLGPRHIALVLPQADASLVQEGMDVRIRLWAEPNHEMLGHVERVGRQFLKKLPHDALSSAFKGEVDTRKSDKYKTTPATPSVLADINLKPTDADRLVDGMTGRGKIITGQTTFGAKQWRQAKKAMSLDWWL